MFFGSFAWQFVSVSLPFHIEAISTFDAATTLAWTGWSLGITSLVTVVAAPVWGRFAGRGDPKTFYVVVEGLQGVGFFGMAIARTLPELFAARMILGVVGAASTFAYIIAGRTPDAGEVRRRVAALQSAMTVGQVIGPLAGALTAARLGFRPSFVLGGLILFGCSALVQWGVPPSPGAGSGPGPRRPIRGLEVAGVAVLVLGGSIQVFFLTAILPQVLPALGVPASRTLEVGGLLIFASGLAAALGALAAPRLADLASERWLIGTLLALSSLLLGAFGLAGSALSYGVLRFAQVLAIAPMFPLVVARVAPHARGEAIGVINSARVGAGFIGPVVATSVLAGASPAALYLLLAGVGLACLPLLGLRQAPGAERTRP